MVRRRSPGSALALSGAPSRTMRKTYIHPSRRGEDAAPQDEVGDISAAVGWAKPTGRANARPMINSACPPFKIAIASMVGTAQGAPLPTNSLTHSQDEGR